MCPAALENNVHLDIILTFRTFICMKLGSDLRFEELPGRPAVAGSSAKVWIRVLHPGTRHHHGYRQISRYILDYKICDKILNFKKLDENVSIANLKKSIELNLRFYENQTFVLNSLFFSCEIKNKLIYRPF